MAMGRRRRLVVTKDRVSVGSYGIVRVQKRLASTGEIVQNVVFKNTIQTFALRQAAILWSGQYVPAPSMIQLGTGAPTPPQTGTTPNDGGLWTPLSGTLLNCDYVTPWLGVYTQYAITYDQTQALAPITGGNPTGQITLTEAALSDINGNCWSHVALTGITHNNQTTLSFQWQVLQQGD